MKGGLKIQLRAVLLSVLLALASLQCVWAAGEVSPLTEENVYDAIMAMKAEYPEGMRWTNADFYQQSVSYMDLNLNGRVGGGYGCVAFAWIMSDAAFGNLPVTAVDRDISEIRVGDILRINRDSHSVIVLDVGSNAVTVAEGNFNSSVHWGRNIKFSNFSSDPYFMRISRWPDGTQSDQQETAADSEDETDTSSSWEPDWSDSTEVEYWTDEDIDAFFAALLELMEEMDPQPAPAQTNPQPAPVQPDPQPAPAQPDPYTSASTSYESETAVQPGTWSQVGDDWFYYTTQGDKATGWQQDGGTWYFFDGQGKMQTGWYQDTDGVWYFLNTQHDGGYGGMLSGWQWIDGYSYYFDASGKMAAGGLTPDGFQVNELGQWVIGSVPQYNPSAGIWTK